MENGTHGATTDGEVMHAPTSRMLSSRIEKVLKRISRMKELRRPWETMFDDCYKYAMPQRERFNSGTVANDLASDIFDSTAVISVQEFASRLQQGLVPSGTQFATLIPGSDIRDTDRKKVTDQLVEINREVYMTIRDSNFDQAVSEAFLDVAIGTAALIGDSGNSITPITFSSVPLTRLLIEGGPWGATEAMGRERKIKAKLIPEVFSNALINDELAKFIQETPEKKLDICELTWRDRTEVTETWDYSVIVKKMQHEIKSERFVGVGSNPWITFRWSVAAGEDWGRGQLLNALPDIRTLNLVKELILENAEIAISGIWQTDDEGVVNGDTINIGSMHVDIMHTPGHTPACMTYVIGDAAFVGDTLFMPDFGTARCDFPGGSADDLYNSIQKILTLPDDTRIFVGHDYKAPGRDEFAWETTVAEQKAHNVHIGGNKVAAEFVKMRMDRDANLSMPKLIVPSIQINMRAGQMPEPEDNGQIYLKVPLNKL